MLQKRITICPVQMPVPESAWTYTTRATSAKQLAVEIRRNIETRGSIRGLPWVDLVVDLRKKRFLGIIFQPFGALNHEDASGIRRLRAVKTRDTIAYYRRLKQEDAEKCRKFAENLCSEAFREQPSFKDAIRLHDADYSTKPVTLPIIDSGKIRLVVFAKRRGEKSNVVGEVVAEHPIGWRPLTTTVDGKPVWYAPFNAAVAKQLWRVQNDANMKRPGYMKELESMMLKLLQREYPDLF
jgi:hypothetical protein